MARIDDISIGKSDHNTKQALLSETEVFLKGRLVHVLRQEKHIIEQIKTLDLTSIKTKKSLYMYRGILSYFKAETMFLEKKNKQEDEKNV